MIIADSSSLGALTGLTAVRQVTVSAENAGLNDKTGFS